MRALSLVALTSALLAACGAGADDPAAGAAGSGAPFIAFGPAFQGFRGWTSMPAQSNGPVDVVHANLGPMIEYVNQLPPAGATEFAIGTVIVKETEEPNVTDRKVFAMVKRGGGYNPDGARGWEWFELQNAGDGSETILWRGVGPPVGETYGGDANGGCNGCHAGAAKNDYVWSSTLQLTR